MDKRPIDTAPTDGTWVLLFGGKTTENFYLEYPEPPHAHRPVVGIWIEDGSWLEGDDENTKGHWYYCYWDGDWRTPYRNPTHWAPLE